MKYTYCLRRFSAFLVDWIITFVIGTALFFVGPRFNPEYLLRPSIKMFSAYGVFLGIAVFVVFSLFRDCVFQSASIGKMIFGLQVVDINTLRKPTASNLIFRNLTFYIPFVEAIVFCVTKGKKLGDMISQTTVVDRKVAKRK